MLLIIRGPSNSFKSTFARNFDPLCIISHDDIRKKLFGSKGYSGEDFKVKNIVNTILKSRLVRGLDVVIDSTNIPLGIIDEYMYIAKEFKTTVYIFSFKRSYHDCVTGNNLRFQSMSEDDYVPSGIISSQCYHYAEITPLVRAKYPKSFYEFDMSNVNLDKVYDKLMSIEDKV